MLTCTIVETDILYFAQTQPEINLPGCNHGAVNTYNTIDPKTLTNGAYTAQQVAANPLCFATQFAVAEIPLITGLSSSALSSSIKSLQGALSSQGCATIGSVNQSALTACPGFSLYGGPTGPVAPGAIQS